MIKRPVTISIVGWYLLVTNMLALLILPLITSVSGPSIKAELEGKGWVYFALYIALVNIPGIISGILIMKGRNWGRFLYLIIIPINIILNGIYDGFEPTILKSVIHVVFIILVFLPRNRGFFSSKNSQEQKNAGDTQDSLDHDHRVSIKYGSKLKRVGSVTLFVSGILMISLLYTAIPKMLEKVDNPPPILIMVMLILFVSIAFCIIPSIFLWGKSDWKKLTSTGFFVAGGLHLLQGSINFSKVSPLLSISDNEFVNKIKATIYSDIILGCIYVSIGALLFIIVKKLGKENEKNTE